ncbi:four helix bundle protein [Nodularia sp. UHCC 0506]|uniref:four helix bundle protein n=1 Tax=Nodularia sp. UHCC 0506 TaxID=3110243 RepID=UPI002B20DB95|nr:four helix bundle protein [Nodularia sp. UHCC 0506]MEA5514603.1 four helix bundle protein [Nodularia sp. UHCC 0506]
MEVSQLTKVGRFEDLIAWQKARILTQLIYQITQQEKLKKDFGLSGQMQRASVSVMSNIAEGFERNRPGEFHQFLSIAKASCAELRSQLYVALDVNYIQQSEFQQIFNQAEEVGRIIGGLRASLDRNRNAVTALPTQHSPLSTQHSYD